MSVIYKTLNHEVLYNFIPKFSCYSYPTFQYIFTFNMLVVNKNPSKATNLSNTPAMPLATTKKVWYFAFALQRRQKLSHPDLFVLAISGETK